MYNGIPLPVNGDLSHFEQNEQNVVEMEAAQKGISVVRNRGNSNSGIMGNSGNNVYRNVDLSPVKSWKNLFSAPKKLMVNCCIPSRIELMERSWSNLLRRRLWRVLICGRGV